MKRVLLIEDDSVLRRNVAELLELSNYQVMSASDGKSGVTRARQDKPDIIICDVIMPNLDGYSVLEILSKDEKTKYIPFIFLSAKTEKQDIRKGMNLGADDYITKPFSEEELITAIESRIAKSAILKEKGKTETTGGTENIQTLDHLKTFIRENGKLIEIDKDKIVYDIYQNPNFIYLVVKGVVKCHKLDEQGKELITGLNKEGDIFGFSSFDQNTFYTETATAIKDSVIIGITRNELKDVFDGNHKVMFEFIELIAKDLTHVKDRLLQMAYSTVNSKTAATILKFAEKLNTNINDPIKISRNDLASAAGISPETFIRSMAIFKKEGAIKIDGRNIQVLDIQKLENYCH